MSVSPGRAACILAAVRTPVGRYRGALSAVRPDDLGGLVLEEVVHRSRVSAHDVEDVFLGCVNQAGEDSQNIARMAVLLAELPVEVAAATVNRLSASGLEAIASAARAITAGEANVCIGGGVESATRAPGTTLGWRLVNPMLEARGYTEPLGQTAENLAVQRYPFFDTPADQVLGTYGLSREAQDALALHSHQKAIAAQDSGLFADEIVPVLVPRDHGVGVVERDEGPRRDTTIERLAALRPAFAEDGRVTAGNSGPPGDGAAAVLLTSAEYAREHGFVPLATVRSYAVAGVLPRFMGIGPVPATAKALRRAALEIDDLDLIEINEAFAAQVLAVLHEWDMAPDDPRLNVNGGEIALGQPLGCSGARLVTTVIHELRRRPEARFALVTVCIGVGQGAAMVLERYEPGASG